MQYVFQLKWQFFPEVIFLKVQLFDNITFGHMTEKLTWNEYLTQ